MARVTAEGIQPTTLEEYVSELGQAFRSALGPDLDLASETPQGQLIGLLALSLAQVDEAMVAVANGFSTSRALGSQLDDLASLLGITRQGATRSTVTATLTGVAGATVPAGSRAGTEVADLFELVDEAVIGPSGSVDAVMQSSQVGPVPAPAGSLTRVIDLVAGWTGITNAGPAVQGRFVETDVEFRHRYGRVVARNVRSSAEAVLAAVLDLPGVVDATIRENATSVAVTEQSKSIAPHSFCLVVEGAPAKRWQTPSRGPSLWGQAPAGTWRWTWPMLADGRSPSPSPG